MVVICEDAPASVRLHDLTSLAEFKSPIQHIQYLKSPVYGRILVIDGEVQHVEAWAPLYHETVVHLPCSFVAAPTRALVLGGGDLFVARELLKYRSIEAVHLVDHDPCVTEATLKVYETAEATATDGRLTMMGMSAERYLRDSEEKYDLIINDAIDLAYADRPTAGGLYDALRQRLSENGIVSDLIYRSIFDRDRFLPAVRWVQAQPRKAMSLVCVPEYPGILHVLAMWGKCGNLGQGLTRTRNLEHPRLMDEECFQWFNPDSLPFYLYLPPYLRRYTR